MFQTALDLLLEYFPSLREFVMLGFPSVFVAYSYLFLAGWLKKNKGWRTGYSRKVFHFLVFLTAAIVQAQLTLTGTIVFGTAVSTVIFYALYKGDGFILYEAMAREKDVPKRTYYIVAPYLATLSGGVLSNILFLLPGASIGYLVTGFGDAVGEPFGTKFGKHKYRVPSFTKVKSYRSYEGSSAVFISTTIAVLIGLILLGINLNLIVLGKALLVALVVTLVEAFSPHGWDNFTTQIAGSGLAYYLFF